MSWLYTGISVCNSPITCSTGKEAYHAWTRNTSAALLLLIQRLFYLPQMATLLPRYSFTTIFSRSQAQLQNPNWASTFLPEASPAKDKYLPESFLYLFICGFRIHLKYLKETRRAEQVWWYSSCFRFLAASSKHLVHWHTDTTLESSPHHGVTSGHEFSPSKPETFSMRHHVRDILPSQCQISLSTPVSFPHSSPMQAAAIPK